MTDAETAQKAQASTSTSPTKTIVGLVVVGVVIAVAYLGGCFGGMVYPDVNVKLRASIIGAGQVLQVTNAGAKPLFEVAVSAAGWEKQYVIAQTLKPGDTAEAGWMELPRPVRPGDTVQIFAKGFGGPRLIRIIEGQ
jgi:hypothetical protein